MKYETLLNKTRAELEQCKGNWALIARAAKISRFKIYDFMKGKVKQPQASDLEVILAAVKRYNAL